MMHAKFIARTGSVKSKEKDIKSICQLAFVINVVFIRLFDNNHFSSIDSTRALNPRWMWAAAALTWRKCKTSFFILGGELNRSRGFEYQLINCPGNWLLQENFFSFWEIFESMERHELECITVEFWCVSVCATRYFPWKTYLFSPALKFFIVYKII